MPGTARVQRLLRLFSQSQSGGGGEGKRHEGGKLGELGGEGMGERGRTGKELGLLQNPDRARD